MTTLAVEVDQLVTGTSCDDWRRPEPHEKTSGLITPRARKERKQEKKERKREQEKSENKKSKSKNTSKSKRNNKTETERQQTRARRKEPQATTQVATTQVDVQIL